MEMIIDGYLRDQKKKRIKTKDVEQHVLTVMGQDRYWTAGGYHAFVKAIESLVKKGVLVPVKAWKTNGLNPPLYNGYKIVSLVEELSPAMKQKLLTQYHPSLNTSYYLTHPKEYKEDAVFLTKLDTFLKENRDFRSLPPITANERSFQIFQDEKWLMSRQGHAFRQRVGLTLEDLRCYPTYEPFFYYSTGLSDDTEKINVLIVENKDTFFSLKSLFQRDLNKWGHTAFTVLIYGEGRKIQKSFTFFWELPEYRECQAEFYYFGDLDPEGILIWYELQQEVKSIEFKPFTFFYNALLQKYAGLAPRMRTEQRFSRKAVSAFLSYFEPLQSKAILKMLEDKRYIPQEGLHYNLLRELSVSSW